MTTLDQSISTRSLQLQALTAINTQDFLAAFGLENLRWSRKVLDALCWLPSRRFARQMVRYDQMIGELGLHRASQKTIQNYVQHLEVEGDQNIPLSGPLLVLSNHPGMTDTLVLFASLKRADLRIVAAQRPFLKALPNISRHLIYVPEREGQRMGVVRSVVNNLRAGGAVLTFPAGQIEPDPISMPGATESLMDWSESIAIFSRPVPELKIVVAIVSGVLWPAATQLPLTRLRRQQKDRERMGAAIQVFIQQVLPFYKPVTTRVVFGPAFSPADVVATNEATSITRAITAQARQLIETIQKSVKWSGIIETSQDSDEPA
jgi:1-acyl-sn-glycerol-3-phosphate acyltransferase